MALRLRQALRGRGGAEHSTTPSEGDEGDWGALQALVGRPSPHTILCRLAVRQVRQAGSFFSPFVFQPFFFSPFFILLVQIPSNVTLVDGRWSRSARMGQELNCTANDFAESRVRCRSALLVPVKPTKTPIVAVIFIGFMKTNEKLFHERPMKSDSLCCIHEDELTPTLPPGGGGFLVDGGSAPPAGGGHGGGGGGGGGAAGPAGPAARWRGASSSPTLL